MAPPQITSITPRTLAYGGVLALIPLAASLVLSATTWARIDALLLPLPRLLPILATLHPIFATPLTAFIVNTLLRRRKRRPISTPVRRIPDYFNRTSLLFLLFLAVYTTLTATVIGTHAASFYPLDRTLKSAWEGFWKEKSPQIRTIQDTLQCCGFVNTHDMAYPFPSKNTGAFVCEKQNPNRGPCRPLLEKETQAALFRLLLSLAVMVVGGAGVGGWAIWRDLEVDERVGNARGIEYSRYGTLGEEDTVGGRVAISSAVPAEGRNGRIRETDEEEDGDRDGVERPLLSNGDRPLLGNDSGFGYQHNY